MCYIQNISILTKPKTTQDCNGSEYGSTGDTIVLDIRGRHLTELETDIWRYRSARCLLASNNALKSPLCLAATLRKLLYVDLSNC